MPSFLFVCTGNICRSPTAEAVFRDYVHRQGLMWACDSAGIYAYHVGEAPDDRSIRVAKERGIDLTKLRARQIIDADYDRFDVCVAMDDSHYRDMMTAALAQHQHKIVRLLDFCNMRDDKNVLDPYYGDTAGFEDCFDVIEYGIQAMVTHYQSL